MSKPINPSTMTTKEQVKNSKVGDFTKKIVINIES